MKKIGLIFLFSMFLYAEDSFLGYWEFENKKVIVEIVKDEEEYKGYVRWLKESVYPEGDNMEGKEQIDRNNPDILLRNRKVLGLKVVGGLKYDKKQEKLVNGWIYDSWNGKYYYGEAKLLDKNNIKLRGSVDKYGIIGISQKIKRVDKKDKMIEN